MKPLVLALALAATSAMAADPVAVFKNATCGCCSKWIEHLEKAGYEVRSKDVEALNAVKARYGVPMELRSCHTAVVGGYVIEGHVPAADIQRLLREKPAVAGLAVPGMPMGSPGMEGPTSERYEVVSFTREGKTAVFARH